MCSRVGFGGVEIVVVVVGVMSACFYDGVCGVVLVIFCGCWGGVVDYDDLTLHFVHLVFLIGFEG